MAIAFLAHNGIGLGHLSRSVVLCDALTEAGLSPVIFAQGYLPEWIADKYPGKKVAVLWKLSAAEKAQIATEIANYVSLSDPAVVFEDTHPEPVELPSLVKRVLVIRPCVTSHMRLLRARHNSTYEGFLIADSPGSPTWPYTPDETKEFLSWKNWHYIGPVYRRATEIEKMAAASRYSLKTEQRLCVFTTGGGGKQDKSGEDIKSFVERSEAIAMAILKENPTARLIFVKGPYFPSNIAVSSIFESIDLEPCMPGLLSLAHGAVIRPGYNTTWECIQGKTPFVPLLSTSFKEPMDERLLGLRSHGLLVDDLPKLLIESGGDKQFSLACERVTSRWDGQPNGQWIGQLIKGWSQREIKRLPSSGSARPLQSDLTLPPELVQPFKARLAKIKHSVKFVIRVDDVVTINENLDWLLRTLVNLRLPASFEVIPYLSELKEKNLTGYDKRNLIEISQHGYSHLPYSTTEDRKHEFSKHSVLPSKTDLRRLSDGFDCLSKAFPRRFHFGFSPPFDSFPNWLGPAWHDLGGRYVSLIWARPIGIMLPFVRISTEIWDWSANKPILPAAILDNLLSNLLRCGMAGLVIHPQLLVNETLREILVQILKLLINCEIKCCPLNSVVMTQAERGLRINREQFIESKT